MVAIFVIAWCLIVVSENVLNRSLHSGIATFALAAVLASAARPLFSGKGNQLTFLPHGIAFVKGELAYADITKVERAGKTVVVETATQSMRLEQDGSQEPFVPSLIDDLQKHLASKVAEVRALADERVVVTEYLRQGAESGVDYRHPPEPRSALEAIARARVMPVKLRIEAARALGDEELGVELSRELASSNEGGNGK